MSSTSAGSSGPDVATQRDSWIPVFSGQPSDYKEWRKRTTLYHQKMVLGKRHGESILNIVGSLTGTAWRLVEDNDVSKAEDESSFADLFCWTGTFSIMIEFNSLWILTATLP